MDRVYTLLLAIFIAGAGFAEPLAQSKARGSLYGTVLILDPGHGGTDPGASRGFNGQRVTENEYVYDVTRRVERLARAKDGIVFITLRHDEGTRDGSPQEIFADNRTERFSHDGSVAVAGTSGLRKRQLYGNAMVRKYPRHRLAWLSIHFDVVGTRKDVDGVRIIHAPNPGSLSLANRLAQSFDQAGRMRAHGPVARNGDPRYGLRNLYILNGGNRAPAKVLVELGNFNNDVDLWRIRDPKVREAYARAIIEAFEK